jgi:capsular exopolysaccharide synthesis family protein
MSKIFEALRKTAGEPLATSVTGARATTPPGARPPEDSPEIQADRIEKVRPVAIELAPGSPVLPFDGSDDEAAEQYRIIRTKINHHPGQPRMILVSSPMPGDGKTVSAINLGAALSLQEDRRVLLMDCDFRRSSATRLLGLNASPGLGEVLRNEAPLEAALVRVAQFPNLYFLPPGGATAGHAELLANARWQSLMELCRSHFHFVVVDAPPVGAVAEYELLQVACDGIVLVVRQDHTNRQLWQRALETVPKAKQIGVILNCAKNWFLWKTHGYYYYSGRAR